MARNQSQDPLVLSPNWHVDCRLTAELPDDRVVSSRFLVNLPFGLVTLGLLMFFGWKFSTYLSLRSNIDDWGRRLADSRIEVANIKQLQRDYAGAAAKIELAHNLINAPLFVTHFTNERHGVPSQGDTGQRPSPHPLEKLVVDRPGLRRSRHGLGRCAGARRARAPQAHHHHSRGTRDSHNRNPP